MPGSVESEPVDEVTAGVRAAQGGLYRIGAYGIASVIGLVGIGTVTRQLGPSGFGEFQTVFSLVALVAVVSEVGLAAVGVREYVRITDPLGRERLVRVVLGVRSVLTLAGLAVALVVAILRSYDTALLLGTVGAGIGILMTVLLTSVTIPMTAKLDFGFIAFQEVLRAFLLTGTYLVLAVGNSGVALFLAATAPAYGLVVLVSAVYGKCGSLLVPLFALGDWWLILRQNWALGLSTSIGTAYLFSTQFASSLVMSNEQLGIYGVAARGFLVVATLPPLLMSVAFPLISRYALTDKARFHSVARGFAEAGILAGSALAVGLLAGASFAINIVGGTAYGDASSSLRILAIAIVVSGLISIWGLALVAMKMHQQILTAYTFALILAVMGTLFLGSLYGASGAAMATVLGECVALLLIFYALRRSRINALPRGILILKVLLALGLAVGAISLLRLGSLAEALLAMLVFSIVVAALRAVPRDALVALPIPQRLRDRMVLITM
jgi:O-antigen/teichoic acid export membrane protein